MSLFAEYAAHGWQLAGIDKGAKSPSYAGWNDAGLPLEALDGLDGAGLLHSLSGTAALDIDDMALAAPWLAERGVVIEDLLKAEDAVMISSGRYNRAKLLYRLKAPMRTLKPKGSGLELRCATAGGKSVQDVLPPTVHPDTKKPYEWKYGDPLIAHWSSLPPMPSSLYALWRNLLAEIPADTLEGSRGDTPIETVRKAIYHYIQVKHKDVSDHDDWLDVGMRLHEQTGGAQEGLDIWDEWSRGDTSKRKNGASRYEGKPALELRYRSFVAGRAGNVGLDTSISQLPAEAAEFGDDEEIEQAPDEETTAQKLAARAKETKATALKALEERLIYVTGAEKYFDTTRRAIINTESGIEHQFTWMMPRKRGGKRESPVLLLKESGTKRTVDGVGFHPGAGVTFKDSEDYTFVNTYDDARRAKAIEPTAEEVEKIDWLFARIDDPDFRKWLKQFYGHVVQRPGIKIKSAPLIWSEVQGNGKTTLVRVIPAKLVGQRYSKEITASQLEDGFTGYLVNTWHVNLTEFRASSRNEREAISKKVEAWIADDAVTVRPMHQVAYTMPNHFFVTGSSNFDDAASIGAMDRKWAIHELRAAQFTEEEQQWIYDEFLSTKRAPGVLRYYFEHVDLTGFVASAKAIQTEARGEMVEASKGGTSTEALEIAFEEGGGPFAKDIVITSEVAEWLRKNSGFRTSVNSLAKTLAKKPFNGTAIVIRAGRHEKFRAQIVRNHASWDSATSRERLEHIRGNDVNLAADLLADDPLLN